MDCYITSPPVGYSTELYHYGTKNMKWGVRRYQYEDKSLTPEGRIHYGVGPARNSKPKLFIPYDEIDEKSDKTLKKLQETNVLAKGTPIYRSSKTDNETLDKYRKYGSIDQEDIEDYALWTISKKKGDKWTSEDKAESNRDSLYRYEAKKDLKVASFDDLKSYARDRYKQEQAEKGKRYIDLLARLKTNDLLAKYSDEFDPEHNNKMQEFFRKQGYDAIPDFVDNSGWDQPDSQAMIFLEPYKSLKLTDVYDLKGKLPEKSGSISSELLSSVKNSGKVKGKIFTLHTHRPTFENARNHGDLDKYKLR